MISTTASVGVAVAAADVDWQVLALEVTWLAALLGAGVAAVVAFALGQLLRRWPVAVALGLAWIGGFAAAGIVVAYAGTYPFLDGSPGGFGVILHLTWNQRMIAVVAAGVAAYLGRHTKLGWQHDPRSR